MSTAFDIGDLKRRMQGTIQTLRHELAGLRTGRASANLVEPVQVHAYGQTMPLNQVATISIPEARTISIQVWDRGMVSAVEKAIRDSNLGLSPVIEGQVLRIRIPELNEQRRKEMVKVAHKYGEDARIAVRHVRRDGIDQLKKQLKDKLIPRRRGKASRSRCPKGDRPGRRRGRSTDRVQGKGNHASLDCRKQSFLYGFDDRT